MHVRDPFFTRSLLEIGGGVADLSKVSMAQLHQIVTLRRDSALWKRTAPSLAPKLVMDLRHAPFLGELSVFPKPLLDSVVDQRHADQKKSLLEKAATSQASFSPASSQQRFQLKRTTSTPVSHTERKRQRKNPAPQKSPAKPTATPVTPKAAKTQPYR